ncbi:MAG: LytTR family transcriptional regulator, partial [Flavobacteriales bacterium]|nr:LytTR family transcriptional regulator [Flavobacteriales bacterium]
VNYTTFYFKDGSKKLITKTLKSFDQMLSESGFYRIHQSHLVNSRYIKEYNKTDGGYLVMTDGSTAPLSIRKKAEVVKLLEKIK